MKTLSLVSLFLAASAFAQFEPSGRTGLFEVGGVIQGFSGDTVDGRFGGVDGELELDDLIGGGINFGYHINEHLNINTDFVFSSADINFFAPNGTRLHD